MVMKYLLEKYQIADIKVLCFLIFSPNFRYAPLFTIKTQNSLNSVQKASITFRTFHILQHIHNFIMNDCLRKPKTPSRWENNFIVLSNLGFFLIVVFYHKGSLCNGIKSIIPPPKT